jgi:hypothetical protein
MKKILLILAVSIVSGCTPAEPTRYQIFGIEKFRQIKRDPERHAGRLYAFGGRVINAEETENQTTFQILVQNHISSTGSHVAGDGPLLVVYPGGETTVADDHQVKVLGYIREPTVGKNLFGATVGSFKLDAIAIYDSFTRYPFRLRRYERLFDKWKTGEPFTAGETQDANGKKKAKSSHDSGG